MPMPQPQNPASVAPPPAGDQQPTIDELPEARPKLSIWHSPWVQNVLPLATSLILHGAILLIGFAAIKTIPKVVEVVREQIIIPDAQIIEGADPGGVPNPGLGDDPNRAAAQDQFQDVPDDAGLAASQVRELNRSLLAGGAENEMALNPLAIGPQVGGPSRGDNSGEGDPGGGIAPFGVPGGGAAGPVAPFMGGSGNARRVVYVVDASGTMMNVFPAVKMELRKALDVLKPIQEFNIIIFRDGDILAFNNSRLEPATPANKGRAFQWIDELYPTGGTDPMPAIRMAFKMQPELMYVLSDGFDMVADFEALVREFRDLNTNGVKINTILLESREDPVLRNVMKRIATDSGGRDITINRDNLY